MIKGKDVKVILSKEANVVYEELNQIVGNEKKNQVESSVHQSLLRSINRVRDLLKINPFAGNQLPKSRIPKKYVQLYGITNLWRIELANRWRMMYSIDGNEIEIVNFVLDIFNHKDYDKLLGYKH
ncbi:hypothetical protein CMI46_02040 [Candidatus Pacearchaeota archaeon]|nr:hypothetical protein [Candidatus Pacearchaeota archaeon]